MPTVRSAPEALAATKGEPHLYNRIPGATYRLQFNADFTLDHAREILDYLQDLGVTDVYASPLYPAAPQSTHGYDTCCHDAIAEALGGINAFENFSAALRKRGMGLLLDIVPNHMGAHEANAWWWDVLKHGRASRYAHYFDIDWSAGNGQAGKVVLPVLGASMSDVLQNGELKVHSAGDEWLVSYHDTRFPVSGATPIDLLRRASENANALRTRDTLAAILDAQHYRLAYWREGLKEINYRRFFDVSSLVALRMEDEEVFRATHKAVFEWIRKGLVTGLRVDHPDGLRDPQRYFERLQERFAAMMGRKTRLYIVAEKILSRQEPLPPDWPVAGTTGYNFLNQLNGLFVAGANERAMTKIYAEFANAPVDFHSIAYSSKKRVLERSFVAEVNSLATRAYELAESSGGPGNLSRDDWRLPILEVIACFPTYRTYVAEESQSLSAADRGVIRQAVEEAIGHRPALKNAIRFLERLLTLEMGLRSDRAHDFALKFQQLTGPAAAKGIEDTAFYNYHRLVSLNEVGGDPAQFGISLEQFHEENHKAAQSWPHSLLTTSTHDTKRGEDARARINVLSEMPTEWRQAVFHWQRLHGRHKTTVAGAPAPDANDEYLFYQTLVGAWPVQMLRIPRQSTAEDRSNLSTFRERIVAYMLKAIKEAKHHTSWTDSNEAYETATRKFLERVLAPDNTEFLMNFTRLQRDIAFFGGMNSLSQALLKVASPGVPDIYQGSELCDLNLVDPDNRRPVDYRPRSVLLENIKGHDQAGFNVDDLISGTWKLFVLQRTLEFRRVHRDLFDYGDYVAVTANGARSDHVCAFARSWQGETVVVVCPRLVRSLTGGRTVLPCGSKIWMEDLLNLGNVNAPALRNVMTGEILTANPPSQVPMAQVLETFPVALLTTV